MQHAGGARTYFQVSSVIFSFKRSLPRQPISYSGRLHFTQRVGVIVNVFTSCPLSSILSRLQPPRRR